MFTEECPEMNIETGRLLRWCWNECRAVA